MANKNDFDWEILQRDLFDYLSRHQKTKKPLVEETAKILNISVSGAYKKINARTQLTLKDMMRISNHYHVSLDRFIAGIHAPVSFHAEGIKHRHASFTDYLKYLLKHFELMQHMQGVEMTYLAGQVPIFHYLQFPHLFYFKLFTWNHLSWKIEKYQGQFDASMYEQDGELNELMQQILSYYYSVPLTEIWNLRMLDSTLDQFKFFLISGKIRNKTEARKIFKEMLDLKEYLKEIAKNGAIFNRRTKEHNQSCRVFLNEIINSTELIYFRDENGMEVIFSAYDTPNFVKSTDGRFCQYTRQWLENIQETSALITSKSGERNMQRAFRLMDKNLEQSEKEIEGIIQFMY